MAITDDKGNKLPQMRIKKTVKSSRERMKAAELAKENRGKLSNRCPYCGYAIRSSGHFQGKHHAA